MRCHFYLIVILCFALNANAQHPANNKTQTFLLDRDSILIDTAILVKGSVFIANYIEGVNYRVNYLHHTLINLNIPKGKIITIQYAAVYYSFSKVYQNKSPNIIQPEFKESVNPYNYDYSKRGFDPMLKNEGLTTSGSIMRGLSLGNGQNAVVNANLNLQLAGRLNNDVDILATISDENNPIQPEGNTQELQDFDQVYVQFSKNKNKLVVGDYLMTRPTDSYFLNYNKKSRGLMTQTQFALPKKQSMQVAAQAALSRGRFIRNIINGAEGNQGPYRLSGNNGEVFIIVISGTEAVYLDGEKLIRGEQNDYTVDYNSGEIVFMARRLITQYSRIIVEFQYSDRNYARTLFGVNTRWDSEKTSVYLNYFTEQDNKNQPFQQSLNDSDKLVLANAGDDLAQAKYLGETKVVPFDTKKILYRKLDTLGFIGVYVYTTDASLDSVFYEVRFSYVGVNKGNYKQGASGANGRVFLWVAPIAGIPQGDFEPYVQLIAPNKLQLLNIGTQFRFKPEHNLTIELGRSVYDKNLYSELNKSDDAGYAIKVESKNSFTIKPQIATIQSNVNYEYTDQNFRYIERYRNVEFNRIWNRQLNNSAEPNAGKLEHILNWRMLYNHKKNGSIYYQLGYYNEGAGSFVGYRNLFGLNLYNTKNKVLGTFEYLSGKQKESTTLLAYGNEVKNLNFVYTRVAKKVNVGTKILVENSAFRNKGDSLLTGSFGYQQMGLFLRSNDSTRFSYFTEVNVRLDQLANAAVFYDHTLAKEAKAGIGLLQKNFNKLNVDVSYRDFRLLDSAISNLKPEQTLLSRIEYDYSFFKRFVTANTYVQLGSGNELRRDFQYVEVAAGLGVYVWKDFNEDGFQQLNEFQLASFADKNIANFIKVFLPSTSLIKVNNTQFSQTININTFSNRRAIGWKAFFNRFSDQAAMRIERKVLLNQINVFANAVNFQLADSSLISLNSLFRNTLFFNRNNPKYGLDFGLNQQQTKSLQTNGFESRNKMEYSLGARFNLSANWSLVAAVNQGKKGFSSEYFSQNNYQYSYQELKPKLTYQFQQKWRVGINYTYSESVNLPELGGDKSKVDEMGAELRYSFVKIGVISFKYNLYQVQFKGNVSSPLAYDMLQGLSTGNNQLWGINFQQRIGQNLQINMSYDGRKSGLAPIIHTGKMEARYLF